MSDFADSSSKLGNTAKKSIFERQKAEAEAKKARDQAETAAVLKEFEKSFEDEGGRDRTGFARPGAPPSAPGRRHFSGAGIKSGPGSLGPVSSSKSGPGSLGPVFGRKRQYDDYSERRDRQNKGGILSYDDERKTAFGNDIDEEEDKAAAKPTLHLSSLPPATSPAVIKALLAQSPLEVESVRILPPAASGEYSTERKSLSAIVVLAADSPGAEIDTTVSHLQNQYLGLGYNLSISRHLSSAVSSVNVATISTNSLPFGAKQAQQNTSLSRAPPLSRRYAPPSSYGSSAPYSRSSTYVNVQIPSDLRQLKLIHKTLEALLTYGPEFEALLMSRPQVQMDEKWSWLFNARSAGGVYYRWRLWEILTDAKGRCKHGRYPAEPLFDGSSIWNPPEENIRFEYTTQLDAFVSDEDYNSSDEEDNDGGGIANRYTDHNASGGTADDSRDNAGYLNPLSKAKLVHLLSRLPDSNSKLRRGDVARITAFAIDHAGAGADEVATIITRNAIKPFNNNGEDDQTPGSLVGLYVISDILSSSASAGVRHAWRYRTLFETAFKRQRIFDKLGRVERDLSWGKLKAEKWRRSIQSLFSQWEGWSVFPQASHEVFVNNFNNPPLTEREKAVVEAEEKRKAADEQINRKKALNRWKSVEGDESHSGTQFSNQAGNGAGSEKHMDTEMGGVDGAAMDDSEMEDVIDENIDGVPMDDSSDEESTALPLSRAADAQGNPFKTPSSDHDPHVLPPPPAPLSPPPPPSSNDVPPTHRSDSSEKEATKVGIVSVSIGGSGGGKRQRPRAADMFADNSD